MMWGWGDGWGWGAWLTMSLTMVAFWGLLAWVIVALVRGRDQTREPARPSPEEILAERFARGEIDAEEYRKRLEVLRGHGPRAGAGGTGR